MAEHQVKVSQIDNIPNWLASKIQGGYGIILTNNGTCLRIDCTGTESNGTIAVDSLDKNLGFLSTKLQAGSNISLVNTGSTVEINAAVQSGDHKVAVDSSDSSPDYLGNKISAGTNVSLTNTGSSIQVSATDTVWPDPMTIEGDIVYENSSLQPARLGIGTNGQVLTVDSGIPSWQTIPTQTGDHKVLATNFDTSGAGYLDSKISFNAPLIATGSNSLAVAIDYGQNGQVLTTEGTTVKWANLPTKIDWFAHPGLGNGSFNQAVDRTFYVRIYPTFEFKKILDVGIIITGPSASDEWRVAVFDSSRNMVAYGTKTGSTMNFQRVTLTMLDDFAPSTTNYYYLAISQHVAGTANSKILTASVTSPSFCWYEDVALTSGRAMPATSNLTASSSKVPIIGLRGR